MNDFFDLNYLQHFLKQQQLMTLEAPLLLAMQHKLAKKHGDAHRWQQALQQLPLFAECRWSVAEDGLHLRAKTPLNAQQQANISDALKALSPWRKGPFFYENVHIDTEWNSLMKWQRVKAGLLAANIDLAQKKVLDIGCANGVMLWAMQQMQAKTVIGIDPMWLFYFQFMVFQRQIRADNLLFLPLPIEAFPEKAVFDFVFSMGVIYHRKSPLEHLETLKKLIKPKGHVLLETLVLPTTTREVLTPVDRYAGMRNVWFIPSPLALRDWVQKMGFSIVFESEIVKTSLAEQQQSEWMHFHSLNQFLDNNNAEKTIEGYPAPHRLFMILKKDDKNQ